MDYVDKPADWPRNYIERQLSLINDATDKFMLNPSNETREILISLVTSYDLNQNSTTGVLRTTDYEVALINTLYRNAAYIHCEALKVYLYELIGSKTRTQKIVSWSPYGVDIHIDAFEFLLDQLRLYYYSYQKYTIEKSKNYSEQLIDVVYETLNELESSKCSNEERKAILFNLTHAYINILQDIAFFRSAKCSGIWRFDKTEIYNLMKLAAELIEKSGDSPCKRPLRGVLFIIISAFILKSRNGYNEDYIYKYVSKDAAYKSMLNHQIWMSKTEFLNDERESKVIPEIFQDNDWKMYPWIKEIDFTTKRTYYVSSFSKAKNDTEMAKKYGDCIFGYKNDRIADLIAPIHNFSKDVKMPMMSQVLAFDVIYDREEARKELIELTKIIDLFSISDDDKHAFLEEIMQYWILSVKDEKWSQEHERRYVVFMYDKLDYIETDAADKHYLKTKTSIFLFPDFIFGDDMIRDKIAHNVTEKMNAVATKDYIFCENCLSCDFDFKEAKSCPICNSEKIKHIYPHN